MSFVVGGLRPVFEAKPEGWRAVLNQLVLRTSPAQVRRGHPTRRQTMAIHDSETIATGRDTTHRADVGELRLSSHVRPCSPTIFIDSQHRPVVALSIFRNNKESNHGNQARSKTNCQVNWQA